VKSACSFNEVGTGNSVLVSSAAAAISGNSPVFSGTLKIFSCRAFVSVAAFSAAGASVACCSSAPAGASPAMDSAAAWLAGGLRKKKRQLLAGLRFKTSQRKIYFFRAIREKRLPENSGQVYTKL
jgi:hypothetical protein